MASPNCGTSKTKTNILKRLKYLALRVSQAITKSTSTAGAFAGAHKLPFLSHKVEEAIRTHLKHRAQHANHYLTLVSLSRQ